MKKYLLFLLFFVFLITYIFVLNTVIVTNNTNKIFADSGYILKSSNDSERYYFAEETTYKNSYNEQIVFEDVQGEKVVINKTNFIHYDDGSISSFTKGVLVDLDTIETEPITYYNISGNKVLKKLSNNKYVTKNLDKEIQFTNLMWKISDSKYLVAGNAMKIVFADGTEKDIDGFIEIEYSDNEIVKIFNQEVKYETISSDVYLSVDENIKINLGTKIVSKDDENEMTLENMVIDEDDNVTIIDLDEYKETEGNTEANSIAGDGEGTQIQGGNASSSADGNVTVNGGSTIVGGETSNEDYTGNLGDVIQGEDSSNNNSNVETEITDDLSVAAPKYTIKEFEVTSTGLKAVVEITDDEARLTTGTVTNILDNATGKSVYTLPETGATEIRIDTSVLEPNKEYTLVMEAAYAIENVEYKKNFVYKIFRTPVLGIVLEKEMFTDESLAFYIKFDADSPVSKLDVELLEAGQVRPGIVNSNGSTERIEFAQLTPDTQYTLQIKNIYIGNENNENVYSYTYNTLKSIPVLANGKTHSNVEVEIDKWNSKFVLSIPDLAEGVVETLSYQVFTETEGQETLVYNMITTDTEITIPINDKIKRNTDYYCRVFATFYDNEKTVEYEIANTETSFNMNSSEMPSIRFEEENEDSITFNSIKGNIVIDDNGNTIDEKTAKVEVLYSSTTKDIDDAGTLTYTGIGEGLTIPIDLKELKSNETYKFSVYTTYDLHDGNGARYGFIGSIMITTKKPIAMQANWTPAEEGISINLQLASTEDSDYEAASLYSFDLALYAGRQGASTTPLATTTLYDDGVDTFSGSLKEIYYNDIGSMITKDTFGLTDAEVEKIEKENNYCTIVITNAQDYVSRNKSKNFVNNIPITPIFKEYQISKTSLKNPSNSSDAITYSAVTKTNLTNMTEEQLSQLNIVTTNDYSSTDEIISNSKINNTTIVAYKMKANIADTQLEKFNYFEYFVYDQNGNVVATTGMIAKPSESTTVPTALFLLSNGTEMENKDEYMARGNKYTFSYYAYETIDKTGKYPKDENDVDYWEVQGMPSLSIAKQKPNIIMYPSTSDSDSITYKYKISDVDEAITREEDGNKYFYQFYAGVGRYENNKKMIEEAEDGNEFYTVKFDKLSQYLSNYNLEVKIEQSTHKSIQASYRTLTVQKLEDIIEESDLGPSAIVETKEGISTTIEFNKLDIRDKIQKMKIELIDTENVIPTIELEKDAKELNSNNWRIEINYLDIIKSQTESIKNKKFKVNIKIYYINGVIGYDNGDDAVIYQTADEDWLRIHADSQEFVKILNADGSKGYPIVYESHKYIFDTSKLTISQNDKDVSWLNYSDVGFTRTIDGEETVIIPKKVKTYEMTDVTEITIENVLPGINGSEDLQVTPAPANAEIVLKNIYSKDTIAEGETIWMDVYDSDTGTLITEAVEMILNNGVLIENLERGKDYYYKLYIKIDENKYYLYDLEEKTNNIKYKFSTLDEVKVTNLKISYLKTSEENKRLMITHGASITRGYKGFVYEIYNSSGNLIKDKITYSIDDVNFETTNNGTFVVTLEDFENNNSALFGTVYLNVNRNTFFEYKTNYTIKVTPIIEIEEGVTENIGNTVSRTYSYSYQVPEMVVYAKRVENLEGNPYLEFSISLVDEDDLICDEYISYKIYQNGYLTACKEGKIDVADYTTIEVSEETVGENFDFNDSYKIEVVYNYYTSNINDNAKQTVTTSKEISEMKNDTYVGTINWEIVDNTQIKLKFYDSYKLSNVQAIKCSIYDVDGRILKNVPTIEEISIIDQTSDELDPHKSITFDPYYTFESGKAYIVSIRFLDANGEEIATFEPEGPITNI